MTIIDNELYAKHNDYDCDKQVYINAIECFGKLSQLDIMIEEMSELTQAICKYKRGIYHNVEEEIADVQIMLEQLKEIFDTNQILQWHEVKINRLRKRIYQRELL